MDLDDTGFSPHTYHLDIRFESAFYQMHELASAINEAVKRKKRVIVEHFDLIYPYLGRNAHLLLGLGEEIIVTRPNIFGPEPDHVKKIVYKSIPYRRMTHTAEDLVSYSLNDYRIHRYEHAEVRHGFILIFDEKPEIDLRELEERVKELIAADLPISYLDDTHILIGDQRHFCTGPRMHVESTGEIENFRLYHEFIRDSITGNYLMVGLVAVDHEFKLSELNQLTLLD